MDEFPHLDHAPITEALVDLRVSAPPFVTRESIDAVEPERFGYYKKGPIIRGSFGFQISTNLNEGRLARPLQGATSIIGVRLHSADEKHVAQFSTEGFTLSRLEPYESWDALVAEARRLWPRYVELASPQGVSRVATRYINNLRLPYETGDQLERFLTVMPNFSDRVPQLISSFLQRFEITDPACGATIILTVALGAKDPSPKVPIILDIDAYKQQNFAPSDEGIWDYLNKLRSLKNRFFFTSITPEAVELYK